MPRKTKAAIEAAAISPDVTKYHPTAWAAAYLGLSKRYLEALRMSGGGPRYTSFGKAVRYTQQALDEWAGTNTRPCASDIKAA
jgi:hypothetical protein